MLRSSIFPGRYIQGENALSVLGDEVLRYGDNALFLLTPFVYDNLLSDVKGAVGDKLVYRMERFGGECSDEEIERVTNISRKKRVNVVIGIGGGKTIDTAKVTAHNIKSPVCIVPSIASTDAPCSANSVIYTENGAFKQYFMLPRNPDIVLVDTGIVARAPVRFLVSGMGDALSTRFEAESCLRNYADNLTGYKGTVTAFRLADLCYEILQEYGLLAKQACERNVVTDALDHVVEANTLLSGLGFESGGLAAAHAIHNGLTVTPATHAFFHGEKVAFGTLVSLFLTDRPSRLVEEVYCFCASVGLPVSLEGIGLAGAGEEDIFTVAEASCSEGETIYNEPIPVTPQAVFEAIREADRYGIQFKARCMKEQRRDVT
jgi:glycerol dehydrogenase